MVGVVREDDESREVSYFRTPPVFYVINNSKKILDKVIGCLRDMGYLPKIGLEVEFYALRVDGIEQLADAVNNFARTEGIDQNGTSAETGEDQFEIEFNPYLDICKLVDDFESLRNFLLDSEFDVLFDALPFYGRARSALQINISLNNGARKNLFVRGPDGEENGLLLNSVAGILGATNGFLPLYIKSEEDLLMFDQEFNCLVHSRGGNPAPTYNSWGINNRSCSVRIPTPKNFFSEKEYRTEGMLNRRIEFRVATADCNLEYALFGLLYSVLWGIQNKLEPPPATSNNVLVHHEGFRRIFVENNLWDILQPSFFSEN
ncbi:MAG: hypothetical protein LBI29_01665 [Rickettsiales bacterium]|jgi:glutamine synthetase|nr:hypothetical protein [Rickettsiales bacterium]